MSLYMSDMDKSALKTGLALANNCEFEAIALENWDETDRPGIALASLN